MVLFNIASKDAFRALNGFLSPLPNRQQTEAQEQKLFFMQNVYVYKTLRYSINIFKLS